MKILIIDNAAITIKKEAYYVYKSTGEFGAELMKLGNEIKFFQFYKDSKSHINTFDLKHNGLKVTVSKIYSFKRLSYLLAYLKAFRRVINSDYIYIFYPNSFSFLAFFAKFIGKKYGLYIRGEVGINTKKSLILYKYADTIFTVSNLFSDKINNILSVKKANTIRPMIPFSEKDIVSDRKYDKTDDFKILFLGRIDRNKGLYELLYGINEIKRKSHLKLHVDIVGDGPDMKTLKEMTIRLGLLDTVNFLGSFNGKEQIKAKFIESDIYILPTYHEGFPRTLYEAMIFGTPIITTFVGGISGLMVDAYNCFKIEKKSSESIAETLNDVLINYARTNEVSKNATKTVMEIIKAHKLTHAQHLNQIINRI